jgi:hypothetical protein
VSDWWEGEDLLEDEDFWISGLKKALGDSVKREHAWEIGRLEEKVALLEKKNSELRDEIAKLADMKSRFSEMEAKVEGAKKWAAEARFGEVVAEFMPELYKVGYEFRHLVEKCEKCDGNRHVEVTLPSGKKAYDDCECSKRILFHYPRPCARYRVGSHGLTAWYRLGGDGDFFDYPIGVDDLYSGQPFEALKKVERMYFKSLDDCQRCCGWLNEREEPRWG